METNIYLQLTDEFNAGRLRAVICSGQAAVLHRVAIMSKDGDWILREDKECCRHIMEVLERHGAHYRFGAPLDIRWLSQGWSAHFEFTSGMLRVRADFFTRPPRINKTELAALWREQAHKNPPFVNPVMLIRLKQTDREKDYAVIGELARRMTEPENQLRFSRSALDLISLGKLYPALAKRLIRERPLLAQISSGRNCLEAALDAERRAMIHLNEKRLARFEKASGRWQERWPELARKKTGLPLRQAHHIIVEEAKKYLPRLVS
ncbi:MAG: hypothetical protein Q7J98_03225 [Kiritimatiellia bacterium]|nr:hypothetical protein [Kiritimatiellia bacterium]